MSIVGRRIFSRVERVDRSLMERFRGIPSSNINDAMNRLYNTNSDIRCITKCSSMLGSVITVKAPLGDNAMFHRALDLAQPGDVIVVDGGGCTKRSLAGEIMMQYAALKKIGGWVVDGALRDLDGLVNAPFPIYCKAITPQGPYKNGPGEINVPVVCGGVAVLPGDIAVGDGDGVVFIHREDVSLVIEEAEAKYSEEAILTKEFQQIGLEGSEGRTHEQLWAHALDKIGVLTIDR